MNDLRFACRQLLKNPGFTAVSVLTLALGIGANTAIFSVVHGVLLKPLPYPNPEQLVTLWERNPQRGFEQERVSGPNYLDWRAQNTVFSEMSISPGWDAPCWPRRTNRAAAAPSCSATVCGNGILAAIRMCSAKRSLSILSGAATTRSSA